MRAFSVPHFAHSKPSEGKNFPKWIQAMENTNAHSKIIAAWLLGASGISFVIFSIVRSFGTAFFSDPVGFFLSHHVLFHRYCCQWRVRSRQNPTYWQFLFLINENYSGDHPTTLGNDWKAANKEYMKFQNMNPIFG
jgi:hypothetical protein